MPWYKWVYNFTFFETFIARQKRQKKKDFHYRNKQQKIFKMPEGR
jgi:hypothetical protein